MKNNNSTIQLRKLYYVFGLLLVATYFVSNSYGKNLTLNNLFSYDIAPDSIPPDSTEEDSLDFYDIVTDTLVYTDGLDIIYELYDTIIYYDTTGTDSTGMVYGRMSSGKKAIDFGIVTAGQNSSRSPFPAMPIQIVPTANGKNINQGLYGINLEGFFKPSSMPNDGTSDYAWQWLIDLEPEVLRFPSGASSKFMHLLHDKNGNPSVGYGYDIDEIAKFYDWTDGYMDSPTHEEIMNDDEDALDVWIGLEDDDDHITNFIDFRNKYKTQLCETRRYIDDFIELVRQIDEAYPGRPAVKVILSLNIVSETAAECKAIADYLRSATLNGNHIVNVTAVELGNETYDKFHCQAMGFKYFDLNPSDKFTGNYWDFINGGNYTNDPPEQAKNELFYVLPAAMKAAGAHDYITAFKTGGGYNYKLGIVGKPLGNEYTFKMESGGTEGCDPNEDWNERIPLYYEDIVSGTTKKKFDAVILHTYFEAENWEHIPFDNIDPEPEPCGLVGDVFYSWPWIFDEPDDRLEDAFSFILGYGTAAENNANFRDFLTKTTFPDIGYKVSYDKFNLQLDFHLPVSSGGKELWVTEWNLKDQHNIYGDGTVENAKLEVFSNGFTHGVLLMQWLLKNIKINSDPAFRPNFFTYSTMQGYGSGSSINLLTLANGQEKEYLGKTGCPYQDNCLTPCDDDANYDKRNYWVRRTTYYVELLYSEIFSISALKYLPCIYLLPSGNLNIAPTTFVKTVPGEEKLLVYYTNVNAGVQKYQLSNGDLEDLFPGAASVSFGEATRTYLKTDQLYSTSGRSSLYDPLLNACYPENEHPLENIPLLETSTDPAIITEPNEAGCASTYCLTAPENSIGYFVIPLTPVYKLADDTYTKVTDITLYPNPAENVFFIKPITDGVYTQETFTVNVFNLQGWLILEKQNITEGEFDISDLPPGCYQVTVELRNKQRFYKPLVKMR